MMDMRRPWELIEQPAVDEHDAGEVIELSLLRHQKAFVDDTTTREVALVGGFGCG
jgi:hypothetical protein